MEIENGVFHCSYIGWDTILSLLPVIDGRGIIISHLITGYVGPVVAHLTEDQEVHGSNPTLA